MARADGCQGTPASRKSPAVRAAEIRVAAEELARASGLGSLSLRSVARRAGVTAALVSHYYPSMEAMVAEVFGGVVGAELDELATGIGQATSATSALRTIIRFVLEAGRDDLTVVWLDAWSLGRRSRALADEVRRRMDDWQRLTAGVIAAGLASGEFRSGDPELSAWQLLALTDGLNAHVLVRSGDRDSLRRRVESLMEHELGLPSGTL